MIPNKLIKEINKYIQPSNDFKKDSNIKILILDGCSTIFGLQLIYYLLSNYPKIKIYNIGMSNDATFKNFKQYNFSNCDITSRKNVERTLRRKWWNHFQILINNTQFGLNLDDKRSEDDGEKNNNIFFDKDEMEKCFYGNVINVLYVTKFFIRQYDRNSASNGYQIINLINVEENSKTKEISNSKVEYVVTKRAIRQIHESLMTETLFPNRVLLVQVPISCSLKGNQKLVQKFVNLIEMGAMGEYNMHETTILTNLRQLFSKKFLLNEMQNIFKEWN